MDRIIVHTPKMEKAAKELGMTVEEYITGRKKRKSSKGTKHDKKIDPEHYKKGIQTWDYIISKEMGYLEGNIIKYVSRYKYKDGKDDLLKAQAYLNKLIETYEETKM